MLNQRHILKHLLTLFVALILALSSCSFYSRPSSRVVVCGISEKGAARINGSTFPEATMFST